MHYGANVKWGDFLLLYIKHESYFVAFEHIYKYFVNLNVSLTTWHIFVDFEMANHSVAITKCGLHETRPMLVAESSSNGIVYRI